MSRARVAARRKAYKDAGRGECATCGAVMPLSAGLVVEHYPADLAHAWEPKARYFCRGSHLESRRVIHFGKNKTGKPREPSPDVAALIDPNFTRADFYAALGQQVTKDDD